MRSENILAPVVERKNQLQIAKDMEVIMDARMDIIINMSCQGI